VRLPLQAGLRLRWYALMAGVFGLTTPAGIALGIAIRAGCDEHSPQALIISGVFDSVSTGTRLPGHPPS
jgi:zinc transporter 1/2/3